ncbi:23S rRNA (adenine(2503)-C(2))-methyltransferase RlmN [Adlercreutzia sp. R25]|uniref:Probable dual-specificity RNA methyltransferase RlmN n=1 Tax=Adlercreutzia shanghongiae TaxID=3111773 RepID=A0ABU6IVG7_9ACTN|nr:MULTISPECIES: 23S rRNA (adenine(2503)-C(2))-methyltransferase RlmN [unclassified Adlercreutzia]MEC4272052.1 23S rRNA (adenine(2503)-C(2))-methyltransferase RlmN [Adlercreutzia sp. R25]MEC4293783.1 23S rRNA (adenine(2503)-C(2))-methyltransferase RlmN [Adlercreutzia sp. R22]
MNNELIKFSEDELCTLLASWGYPRFRGKQVFEWVHHHHASSFDEMSNLPKDLRKRLADEFPLNAIALLDRQVSQDGTRKYVVRLSDGTLVETVGMPVFKKDGSIDRLTVCVSSQVGCPMACRFCATGREGLTRNLEASEIIAQVALVQKDFKNRVSNIVVMGQGEPFLNYEEVLSALRILNSSQDFNIGARHITISTCGLITGINRFAEEPEQFTLAVSLHSAIQRKRDALMPNVSQQPLPLLKEALRAYTQKTNRRVTFEYLLIEGANDSEEDLQALIEFCEGLLCHVNLLPVNTVDGSPLKPSSEETANHWVTSLSSHGIETSFRRSRGSDIDGACGQLKNKMKRVQD